MKAQKAWDTAFDAYEAAASNPSSKPEEVKAKDKAREQARDAFYDLLKKERNRVKEALEAGKTLSLRMSWDALKKNKCPDDVGMYLPSEPPKPGSELHLVAVSTDSNKWCTYGGAKPQYVTVVPGDLGGPGVAVSNKATAGEVVASRTPAVGRPADNKMPSARPREPQKPAAPQTDKPTDKQPSTPVISTDTPSTPEAPKLDDTVVNFKGNQVELEKKLAEKKPEQNQELASQHLAMVVPTNTPELPTEGQNKAALDKGFDKEPMQATLDGKGEGKVTIPADELADYMPGAKPGQSYRLDFNMLKDSGGIVETTDKPAPKSDTPKGVLASAETFKIGSRTFQRRSYSTPYDVNFSNARGEKTDYCRTAEPGLPLNAQQRSFSALNQELAGKLISLANDQNKER